MRSLAVGESTEHHLSKIARGGALGLGGAAVAGVSGFLLVVVVARWARPEEAGVFFAVTALFLMVEGVAMLGTDTGLARFLLRLEATDRPLVTPVLWRVVRTTLLAVVAVAVVLGLAAGPLCEALGWSRDAAWSLRLLAVALPAAMAVDLALATTRAFGEIRSTVLIDRIVRAGAQPVLVGAALASGTGLRGAVLAWAATHLVAAGLAIRAARRCLRRRGHLSPSKPRSGGTAAALSAGSELASAEFSRSVDRAVSEFWSFTRLRGVARAAQQGMQKIDILLVAAILSPTVAVAYTVATRFVPLGQLGTQAIQQVLQPQMTAILVKEDRRALRDVHQIATAWSMLVAWPVYLGVMALSVTYLDLFGAEAVRADPAQARTVVVIMAAAMLLAVASGPVDTLLLMSGRSGVSALNAVAALVIDVVGCLLLLPRIGMLGAALAWAAAVLVRCTLAFAQVRRDLGIHALSPVTLRAAVIPLGCVGLPAAALAVVSPPTGVLWVGVVAIAGLYVAVLWWWRRAVVPGGLLTGALLNGRRSGARSARDSGSAGAAAPHPSEARLPDQDLPAGAPDPALLEQVSPEQVVAEDSASDPTVTVHVQTENAQPVRARARSQVDT